MRGRSWMGWAAVVVATMGVGATSAWAATITFNVPIAGTITSSCTGDTIAINGTMHVKQTDNGSLGGIKSQIETNLTGVRGITPTGVSYVMNDQTSDMQHADLDDAQVTVEHTTILTRQRETTTATTLVTGGDDLRLHTLAHLTVTNGVMKAEKVEFRDECR